eukprot:11858753-Alexandrium_andersonii.AAC.1
MSSGPKSIPRWRGPSAPNGPNSPLRDSDKAKVGDASSSLPDAGGAARSAAPPVSGHAEWGSPTFS